MRTHRAKTAVVGSGQESLFGAVATPYEPRVYRCEVCGDSACYGLSWPLAPFDQWFCPHHIPAGFLPQQRSAVA